MAARGHKSGRGAAAFWLVVCVVLGAMLVCNLAILVKGALSPGEPPSVLGVTPLVVLSGSMSGEQDGHIEVGDLILVGPADAQTLQVGDVIAFAEGSATVTHRITRIEETDAGDRVFTTKGDANDAEDASPVTADQLVGIYLCRIPKAGDFALFLQRPLGMLLFVGVPVLAFLLYDVIRRQRAAERQRRAEADMQAELERLREIAAEKHGEAESAARSETR